VATPAARLPTLYLAECVLAYLEPSEAVGVLATAAAGGDAGGGAPAAVAIYEQTRPDDAFGATMITNLEVRAVSWVGGSAARHAAPPRHARASHTLSPVPPSLAPQARGCPLRSTPAVPSLAAQVARLLAAGWDAAAAANMAAVYYGGSSSSSSGGRGRPFGLPHAPAAAAAGSDDSSSSDSGWLAPSWQSERRRIESLEFLDELEEWRLLQVRRGRGVEESTRVRGHSHAAALWCA
jgi:hypothetical protein